MITNYPVNPRVRAYGKARIDIAQRVKTAEDWAKLWKDPSYSFPFAWGNEWKQCIEYKVDDFAAEIGFFIDILGLSVNAISSDYAMFTSPQGDFYFAVAPASQGEGSTPPGAFRLQFMVADILFTTREMERRGIQFDQLPQPCQPGSSFTISSFRTPHGISVDLWGMLTTSTPPGALEITLNQPGDEDELDDESLEDDKELDSDDEEEEVDLDEVSEEADSEEAGEPGDDEDFNEFEEDEIPGEYDDEDGFNSGDDDADDEEFEPDEDDEQLDEDDGELDEDDEEEFDEDDNDGFDGEDD